MDAQVPLASALDARGRSLAFGLTSAVLFLALLTAPRVLHADPLPAISIDDARVKEGDSGLTDLVFTVHLSAPSDSLVTVDFVTEDGTATASDSDYIAVSGQLTFAPTDTLAMIVVQVVGDTLLEGNEWFRVRLSNPLGAALADSEAIGVILNDERTHFVLSDAKFKPYFGGTLPNAWGDFDNDGYPDLPLYHASDSGVFTEIPGFRAQLANGNYHGVAWCDYDRDGDLDLVLIGYGGVEGGTPTPTRLLRNDGFGAFTDVAPALGMDIVASGETAVWGDFDGDGWPDLFAPYYSFIYPFRSFLYHNNGDSTFTDRAVAAGVDLPNIEIGLRPEGAAAADWNDDGHLDLYCASHLFINDGTGNFTDVREAVGLPVIPDEGANFVDYNNDGALDLYIRGLDGPHLFRNDGGHFTEVTAAAHLDTIPSQWGDTWADVDGDGDMDLLLTVGGENARLMLNQGDGTFERDTVFDLLDVRPDLPAWADTDLDGELDLVVGSGYVRNLYKNTLHKRLGYEGSRLAVRVLDAEGHQTAHGATVRLRQIDSPPGFVQTRVVDGGSGYLCQGDYTVHFGGVGVGRYSLEVVYPSPPGSRVVVDSLVNPILGALEPATMGHHLVTVYRDGRVELSGNPVAGVGPQPLRNAPHRLLGTPSPAPARRRVSIPLQLDLAARVTLSIHDAGGRLVRRLDSGSLPAGLHALDWDLTDERGGPAATGVYFCRLILNGHPKDVRRVLVVR